ncbi:MAG: response regulator [Planctomycetota bacterium]
MLVVDDHPQNAELLREYLDELGCPVRCVPDGESALRSVENQPPDVILLDVMMPRMSGYQVCEKLKQDDSTREIAVVMVTALHDPADVERAAEAGADDFVTKPVNRVALQMRVRTVLELAALRRS